MLYNLVIFLPAFTCLFWAILHGFLASRTGTFFLVLILLSFLGGFLFTDACYTAEGLSLHAQSRVAILEMGTAPCVIPFLWLYLDKQLKDSVYDPLWMAWLIFPAALLAASILLNIVVGDAVLEEFLQRLNTEGPAAAASYIGKPVYSYYIWTEWVFRGSLLLEFLIFLVYFIRVAAKAGWKFLAVRAFFVKGGRIQVAHVQFALSCFFLFPLLIKVSFFKSYLNLHPWIPLLESVLVFVFLFLFAFIALFSARETISLEEILSVMRYNYNRETKANVVGRQMEDLLSEAEEDTLESLKPKVSGVSGNQDGKVAKAILSAMTTSWDEKSLLARFQRLIVEEKLFLVPGLSLDEVSEKLHTNRTYISKLVNTSYEMGFPEFLNQLRIDYAEEFLLSHPEMSQADVAKACGFLSASSFNVAFKRITGMTPRMWMASHVRN